MPSVLSRVGASSVLSVGLAVGAGVGAVVSAMGQKGPSPVDAGDEVESLKSERDALAARLKEAQLRIEALEQEQRVLKGELVQESEKSSKVAAELEDATGQVKTLTQRCDDFQAKHVEGLNQVGTMEAELEALQQEIARNKLEYEAEQIAMRKDLDKSKDAEASMAILEAELNTVRKEFSECAFVAAQCEAAEHKARTLELERETMRAKARAELEEVRKQVFELKAERDAAMVQREEAIRNVRILKEEQESLQAEVKVHEQKRKDSLRTLSRSLSDIGAQLDSAQASWTPRQQIGDTRKRVDMLQKDLCGEENSEQDMLCGA